MMLTRHQKDVLWTHQQMGLIVMRASIVDNPLVLPRTPRPDPAASTPRPVSQVVTAHSRLEGDRFAIRRPFPGGLPLAEAKPLDVLLLGGLPIREPVAHYGSFVMNTRAEIIQAVEDHQGGRLGAPPRRTGHRHRPPRRNSGEVLDQPKERHDPDRDHPRQHPPRT
jgi:hypothetical protein